MSSCRATNVRRYTSRVGTGLHDEDVSGSWVHYEDARALLTRAETAEREREELREAHQDLCSVLGMYDFAEGQGPVWATPKQVLDRVVELAETESDRARLQERVRELEAMRLRSSTNMALTEVERARVIGLVASLRREADEYARQARGASWEHCSIQQTSMLDAAELLERLLTSEWSEMSYHRGRQAGRADIGKYSAALDAIEKALGLPTQDMRATVEYVAKLAGDAKRLQERVRELEAEMWYRQEGKP